MKPIKVVTFGRSSQNDVVLNDSKASRTHCQIIQYDNGSFAIADFGSTNGTFVNGVRINGQAPLNETDSVRVASTELFWQKYFTTQKKTSSKTWLWGAVATGAVVVVAIVAMLISGSSGTRNTDIRYEGQYPSVAQVSYEEGGQRYTIEAVQGQVIVFFNEDVSHDEAVGTVQKAGGKVVAQIPEAHYYLVEVGTGNENGFIQQIHNNTIVKNIYLNTVSKPCSPKPCVMDLFYEKRDQVPHGKIVSYAMRQCGHGLKTLAYEEGNKGNDFITSEILADLKEIVSDTTDDAPAIINMSFGFDIDAEYWEDASEESKKNYRYYYIAEFKEFISIVKEYDDKDFVVIKAAGNEGVKEFEKEIIAPLWASLNAEEKEIMDRHFLIVSAKDTRYDTYSNELEKKIHNPWVTKVDISDFQYNGRNEYGTSIAAPRAGCYITSVTYKYDIKATEVLKYARKATQLHPEHLLTEEMLDSLVKANKELKERSVKYEPPIKIEEKQPPSTKTSSGTDVPSFLIGTKWKHTFFKTNYEILEFINEKEVRKIEYSELSDAPVNDYILLYHCEYDEQQKTYVIYGVVQGKRLIYDGEVLTSDDGIGLTVFRRI